MGNLESLFFYIGMFIISSLCIYRSEHTEHKLKKRIYVILGLLIPILISGMRWSVGTDFKTYLTLYNNYKIIDFSSNELLFILILKLGHILGNIKWFFSIYAVLTVFFAYKAIKDNNIGKPKYLAFALYLFLHFTTSFNIVRQALAISIVFYSYKYIFDKKIFKFALCIGLAALTHTTALLCFPIYFIVPKNDKKWGKVRIIQIFAIVIILLVILNYDTVMTFLTKLVSFEKYAAYTNKLSARNFSIILDMAIVVIFIIIRKLLVKYDPKNNVYIIFSIIGVILSFSGIYSPFIKRIALYFDIAQIHLLNSLPGICKSKRERVLITFLVICYVISRFIVSVYITRQGDIIPYNIK